MRTTAVALAALMILVHAAAGCGGSGGGGQPSTNDASVPGQDGGDALDASDDPDASVAAELDASDSVDASVDSGPVGEPPILTWVEPVPGIVVPVGVAVLLEVACSDAEDASGELGIAWTIDGEAHGGSGTTQSVMFEDAGTFTLEATCTDTDERTDTRQLQITAQAPPRVPYLSTEYQTAYDELLWCAPIGAPTVLNQPLFAPGGKLGEMLPAGEHVFYFADHAIEGREQLFRANASDRTMPTEVTEPFAAGDAIDVQRSPDGDGFSYLAQQNAAGIYEVFYVDATAPSPAAVALNPTLGGSEDAERAYFSSTGRYVAFSVADTSTPGAYDVYLYDLATGGSAVKVLTDVGYLDPPVAFSSDDAYAAVGGDSEAFALDLSTLHDPTPSMVQFVSVSTNRLRQLSFLESQPYVAYVARVGASPDFTLHVVDVAAELAGSDQVNAVVFNGGEVVVQGNTRVRACGSSVVFTAEVNTFYDEVYRVDLEAWVAEHRATPGSETSPVRLHAPPAETESHTNNIGAFAPDCSGFAWVGRIDHDDDHGASTPEVYALQYVAWANAGNPTILASDADFGTAGLYPDLAFSPGGTRLVWRVGSFGSYRAWTTSLASVSPVRVADSLDGEIDEYLWLDDDRLLLQSDGDTSDAGIYVWNATAPSSQTLISAPSFNGYLWFLDAAGDTLVYRQDYNATVREVFSVPIATPGVVTQQSGDGETNGADVLGAWLVEDGDRVVFHAQNDNNGQTKLYVVDPADPGEVTELYPADGDPAANVAGTTLRYVASTNTLIYRAYKDGAWGLWQTDLDTGGAPTQIDTAPATSVNMLLAVSSNGKWALYNATDTTQKLYLKDLTTNDAASLVSETRASTSSPASFSASGRYVAWIDTSTPSRGYVLDTQNLGAGPSLLTPPGLPTQLPASAEDSTLRATAGTDEVFFSAEEGFVHYAYDDTYAGNLKLVRNVLPALDDEVRVHSAVTGKQRIGNWAMSDDRKYVVFKKHVYPQGESESGVEWLYVVDTTDLSERVLSPELSHTGDGVASWGLFGDAAWMRATDGTSSGTDLYVAHMDGEIEPWMVNADDLVSSNSLNVIGIERRDDTAWVAYAAQQNGDAVPQLYSVRNHAGEVTRVRLSPSDPDTIEAVTTHDGTWLWSIHTVAGDAGPLTVRSMSFPEAPITIGAEPVATGRAKLPTTL